MSDRKQLTEAFAAEITRLRKKKKLSKNALSELSGVARSMVVTIEQAKKNPTVDTLARLAHALGISPDKMVSKAWKAVSHQK